MLDERKRARIVAVLALAGTLAACGGDGLTDTEREAFGAYTLTAINDLLLPFTLGRSCGDRAERGYMELGRENRFYVEIDVSKPGCPGEAQRTWVGGGIWTVHNGDVRLVSDPGGDRVVRFGAAAAPFDGSDLRASGALEGEGYQTAAITFTFTLNR
jgi:hypothetical protein